jgi:S-adenosylmethionine:tRNA ribosyltransferase-isomerase
VKPATWPRDEPLDERLLVIDANAETTRDAHVRELSSLLQGGDLLVVNDAATLPASFDAHTESGRALEIRLLARANDDATWRAVLFDDHDWRTRTEDRAAPPRLDAGAHLDFGGDLHAAIIDVDAISPRLVTLRFASTGSALWSKLYRLGRPVQYAHVAAPLELWAAQTPYASRPWAVELPSAGRPLHARVLASLRARGIEIASLTHAAGLSATGDLDLDAALPLPERFDIPVATVDAIERARRRGARVVAAGTTVVRALEGCAALHDGALVAGEGTTDLHIDGSLRLRVIGGIFTGLHDPTASHFRLLQAFAPLPLLEAAYAHAERTGYSNHEFGDSSLILARAS